MGSVFFFFLIEFFCVKGSKAHVTETLRKQYQSSISPAHISAPYRMHRCICCVYVDLPQELGYSDRLWQGLFSTYLQGSWSCLVEVKLVLSGPFQSQPYSVSNPTSSTTFCSCHPSIFTFAYPEPQARPEDDSNCWWASEPLPPSAPCRHNGPSSSRHAITCDSMRTADLRKEPHVV